MTNLQRDDAIPLYHQIFQALRDVILSGTVPLGAAVPTENELSERFGVCRITARRAMQELSDSGLVERAAALAPASFTAPDPQEARARWNLRSIR